MNHNPDTPSRRTFIKTTGTMAAASLVPRYVLGGPQYTPPSDKLNVAIVGAGGQGMTNLKAILENDDVQIVAIADTALEADYSYSYHKVMGGRKPGYDVVTQHYQQNEATKDYPECHVYTDFRELLDKEKNIDAVCVSTPDHTHYIIGKAVIEHGKHLYIEKPMCRTIYETRKLTELAR